MKHPRVYGSLLSVFILIVLASCATLPRSDVYVPSAKEDNRGRIEDIERKLVLQYRKADSSESAAVKKKLDSLVSLPSSDSSYLARLHALYADWYLLNRDKAAARKMLKTAQNYNAEDEYVLLISSAYCKKPMKNGTFLKAH